MDISFRDEPGQDLSLLLWPMNGDPLINAGGDDCVDSETAPGFYTATIAVDVPAGWYEARIYDDVGLIGSGVVQVLEAAESALVNGFLQHLDSDVSQEQLAADIGHQVAADLAASKRITVQIPSLEGNQLSAPLVQGASYLTADARALTFSNSDFAEIPVDAAVTLRARGTGADGQARQFSLDGEVVTGSGATKTVRFSFGSATSAQFAPGRYEWQVDVELSAGNTAPFVGPDVFLEVLAAVEVSA